ncbi:UNVERIFIED_CONTAM: TetR family transcriptional regulator [Williamsia faeni]
MSSKAADVPRRRLSPEARQAEIIRAGARLFGENAYDSVRMDDVAEAAGVSRALMYRYFPDKRSVFVAVLNSLSDKMLERTEATIDPAASAFGQVRVGVLGYLEQYENHPHAADTILLGIGDTDPQLISRDHRDREYLSNLVVGRLRDMLDVELPEDAQQLMPVIVGAWLAFTQEFMRQWALHRSIGRDEVADRCAHALLDALVRLPGLPDEVVEFLNAGRI